jgi:hypothetical protein
MALALSDTLRTAGYFSGWVARYIARVNLPRPLQAQDSSFVSAALERAVSAVGMPEVVETLNSPAAVIRDWMNRYVAMPDRKVMVLINLLAEIEGHDSRPANRP